MAEMIPLTPNEDAYWQKYLLTLPEDERHTNFVVSSGFGGNAGITDELLALYLSGKKTAGSSLLEDYISTRCPPPKVGNFWVYLNSRSEPSCILRTERIEINKFRDVPVEIAIAEGEGDLSLGYWRKVHSEIYSPFLSGWGVTNIEDATVITEYFKIVYR